jgi:hypothetical protein
VFWLNDILVSITRTAVEPSSSWNYLSVCLSVSRLFLCILLFLFSFSGKRHFRSVQALPLSPSQFGKCITEWALSWTVICKGGFLFISIDPFQTQIVKDWKTVYKWYNREECGGSLNAASCIVTLKGIILIFMKYCVLVIVGYWLLLLLLLLAVGFVGCCYCWLLVISYCWL